MQFIEKNSFNVRTAVYHLRTKGSDLEFVVFPMIHVGEQRFFDEITKRLAHCDIILAEGVKSRRGRLLTLSYTVVKKIRRMNLVTQQEGLRIGSLGSKVVNADMEGAAFDKRFDSISLGLRLQLLFLVPLYALYLLVSGTRATIARDIALEDLPSSDEVLFENGQFENLNTLVIDERDRILIRNIQSLYESRKNSKQTAGILFGARHMRSVVAFLMQGLKFQIVKAEWVTIFEL